MKVLPPFPKKQFQLLDPKIWRKVENVISKHSEHQLLDVKLSSVSYSKTLTMNKCWFKYSWRLYLAFPENSLNFVTQNLAKKQNMPFSNAPNIRFWPEVILKTVLNVLPCFSRKRFQLHHSKIWKKKVKNVIFESSEIFFFELKVDLKPFSRIFLLMILGYLNSFARFGPWIWKQFWKLCFSL